LKSSRHRAAGAAAELGVEAVAEPEAAELAEVGSVEEEAE